MSLASLKMYKQSHKKIHLCEWRGGKHSGLVGGGVTLQNFKKKPRVSKGRWEAWTLPRHRSASVCGSSGHLLPALHFSRISRSFPSIKMSAKIYLLGKFNLGWWTADALVKIAVRRSDSPPDSPGRTRVGEQSASLWTMCADALSLGSGSQGLGVGLGFRDSGNSQKLNKSILGFYRIFRGSLSLESQMFVPPSTPPN